MNYEERGTVFECHGDSLVGVLAIPTGLSTDTAVLVIVGGPQYRAGSHRQFVLLSRQLAEHGIACMRFDCRGMGDSMGVQRSFDELNDDVTSAIAAFMREVSTIRRVVLWGLCDGASAACLYAPTDERVSGLVLVNPWVMTETTTAKTYLKHYYWRRLFSKEFWQKVRRGKVNLGDAGLGILSAAAKASQRGASVSSTHSKSLPSRMSSSVRRRPVPLLIVLSGRDYVAREFDEVTKLDRNWRELFDGSEVVRLPEADHTFSTADWRKSVSEATVRWISGLHQAAALPTTPSTHAITRVAGKSS